MEIGIIGLPFSGKTTLFSTLTGNVRPEAHGTGKIEVHRGVVKVPDSRLNELTKIFKPKKQVNAIIEYLEVGGLEKDVARSGNMDPQFLTILKNTAALCLVIRTFENDIYPHPEGSTNPVRDIKMIESEFILSDLIIVENRIDRLKKQLMKVKSDENVKELDLMERCLKILEEERPLREASFTPEEKFKMRGFQFLSAKPLIIFINYGEDDISREGQILGKLTEFSNLPNVTLTGLSAKVEYEISQLSEEDRSVFLAEMGIEQPALNKLIRESYDLLGLISFFTVGDDECRAWTVPVHTNAQKAAGEIHSDLERGFIRAEVVNFKDFIKLGSLAKCRESGILRLEGKEYQVQDGDIMTVRFNV